MELRRDIKGSGERSRGTATQRRVSRLLDLTTLTRLEADLAPFPLQQLVVLHINQARIYRAEVLSCLAHADFESLRQVAHAIKGSAATFGTRSLRDLASRVESACRDEKHLKARRLARGLPSLIDASVGALSQHYKLQL